MPASFPCNNKSMHATAGHCLQCHVSETNNLVTELWKDADEPKLIYELFFSDSAVKKWKSHMRCWQPAVDYSGVFVHARPFCNFNGHANTEISINSQGDHRCELGDALFVYSDYVVRRRKAILFQAKIQDRNKPIKFDNLGQKELYEYWPRFWYSLQTPKQGWTRRIRKMPFFNSDDPAAQIMVLKEKLKTVTVASITQLAIEIEMGKLIDRLLNGSAGREFTWNHPSSGKSISSSVNDWDRLIWDLLTHTYACKMPPKIAGPSGGIRGIPLKLKTLNVHDQTGGRGPESDGKNQPSSEEFQIPVIHLIREKPVQ